MRVAVKSTTLATAEYDEARELLRLEFCSQVVYLYFDVPPTVFQALLCAPSKGRYFNQTIRGRFRYHLIANFDIARQGAEMPAKCHR